MSVDTHDSNRYFKPEQHLLFLRQVQHNKTSNFQINLAFSKNLFPATSRSILYWSHLLFPSGNVQNIMVQSQENNLRDYFLFKVEKRFAMSSLLKLVQVAACLLAGLGLVACDGGGVALEAGDLEISSSETDALSPVRTPLVVNGTDVTDLRYPFMAAVHFRRPGSPFFSQGCGASLISDRWVVSAAHCYIDAGLGQRSPQDVALVLGTPDLNNITSQNVSLVSRIIIHPQYNRGLNLNDIALLELAEPVSLQPITLPSTSNPVPNDGENSTVAGWGVLSETGVPSSLLQEADLPIVSTNACQSLYGNIINGSAHLCAGGQQTDACFGDSGGPLFVSRGDQVVQAGVVSFGFGCARPGLPAVYTRASTYFDWISSIVPGLQAFDEDNETVEPEDNILVQIRKSNATAFAVESSPGGTSGQNVFLWTANANNVNQQWVEINRGDGFYSYQKNGTDFCMDGNNGGSNRQNVQLEACNSSNQNQLWQKISVGDGAVRLIKRNAGGFALDGGNGGARGQNVRIFDSSNPSQNLNWIVTRL